MRYRRDDLYTSLRRLGLGPVGAILIVAFSLTLFMAATTIPAYEGAAQLAEIRFYAVVLLILGGASAAHVWISLRRAGNAAPPEERLAPIGGTADGVSIRIALDAAAAEEVARTLDTVARYPKPEQLRYVAKALLDARPGWALGSLDSLARMPEERMSALAARLVADAERRYPPRSAGARGGHGDLVVWSVVVTSALTIEEPRSEGGEAIAIVLRNLVAIASDARTAEIRVSSPIGHTQLSERDPALRSLRA